MKTSFLAVLLACVVSAPCFAQPAPTSAGESLQILREQQNELKADLDKGDVGALTPRQVGAIRKAQTEFFAVTEGKPALASLSMDQKIHLDNALERINAEVKGTRLGRQEQDTCWRERKTGSSVKVTRCGTKAERDEAREGARAWMERPKICVPPGCGS